MYIIVNVNTGLQLQLTLVETCNATDEAAPAKRTLALASAFSTSTAEATARLSTAREHRPNHAAKTEAAVCKCSVHVLFHVFLFKVNFANVYNPSCVVVFRAGGCECPYPYTGSQCETIDYCQNNYCEHGSCSVSNNGQQMINFRSILSITELL